MADRFSKNREIGGNEWAEIGFGCFQNRFKMGLERFANNLQ